MYRGGAGQWAWLLQRVTGVGVLVFLIAHILDTALVLFGPELYNRFVQFYAQPAVRVGEVALAAAVLYHALNGIRITVLDFYPELSGWQREFFYGVLVVSFLGSLAGAFIILKPLF